MSATVAAVAPVDLTAAVPGARTLLVAYLDRLVEELAAYHVHFALLEAGPDADWHVRALQQFVGEGGWDDAATLAAHQRLVDETLGEDDGGADHRWARDAQAGTHSVHPDPSLPTRPRCRPCLTLPATSPTSTGSKSDDHGLFIGASV